eukprot:SAG31_NODE_2360_length_5872_cov_20.790230_3_plen_143_part_00
MHDRATRGCRGLARHNPGSLHHLQCLSQKVRLTASLLLPLCALMAAVRAAETETQCESASERDACQDAEGSNGLQEHCAAECAVVFLPWFDDAQGTCFTALHLDEQTEQTLLPSLQFATQRPVGLTCLGQSSSGQATARTRR